MIAERTPATQLEFQHFYQSCLEAEYWMRSRKNPNYSLRAFARDLRLSPALISLVLRRKKGLGARGLKHILEVLKMSEHCRALFELSVLAQHSRSPDCRQLARTKFVELSRIHESKLCLDPTEPIGK